MDNAVTLDKLIALFQETREQFRETDRKFQETDRKFQETDRRFQETDRKFQETDRKIKEVSQLVGNLGNRLGEFVENMVLPAVLRLFQQRGIEVHQVFPNAKASRNGEAIEVDILAVNGVELVATECKSRLAKEHVDEHIARIGKIRRLFTQLSGHRIYGAVATMVLDEEVARYAEEKGLFIIAQSGDTVEIRNQPAFQPTAFE